MGTPLELAGSRLLGRELEPEEVGGWSDGHFGKLVPGPAGPSLVGGAGERGSWWLSEERCSPRTLLSSKPPFPSLGCITLV